MNRRVLFIGIAATLVVILVGVAMWLLFSDSSSPSTILPAGEAGSGQAIPTSIEASALPVPSSNSVSPTPIPSVSNAPIVFQGICPDTWVNQVDTDGDSLPDAVEATYGTDASVSDTDGDRYSDGAEVRNGYHPLDGNSITRLDSDNDGLFDNEECVWSTDAFNPDSDTDGFQDGAEVTNGYDPAKKGDGKGSDKIQPQATSTPEVVVGFATPRPVTIQTTPVISSTAVQISLIPLSQLKTTSSTASADVKTYLTQVDGLRPQELSDGKTIAAAIQSAAAGNLQSLSAVRARIAQFSSALKGVPAPKPAQEYHQLYISLIDFTVQKLQAIEQNATGDQQKAAQAVLSIQSTLPNYVTRLSSLRVAVEGVANK